MGRACQDDGVHSADIENVASGSSEREEVNNFICPIKLAGGRFCDSQMRWKSGGEEENSRGDGRTGRIIASGIDTRERVFPLVAFELLQGARKAKIQ